LSIYLLILSSDPVMRDEILDILREYMIKENRCIFFSTHITSNLEKIADYIIYINKGRDCIIGLREHIGGFEGMIEVSQIGGFPPTVIRESLIIFT